MKIKPGTLFLTFLWCLFMGVFAISIGFGAVFPSMNRIAKPFVCPNGEMQLTTQDYHPSPVETVTTLTWYCVDSKTGAKTELGIFPMCLYAWTIYGLLLFGVIFAVMSIMSRRSVADPQTNDPLSNANDQDITQTPRRTRTSTDALEKMLELKKLRDANLISEAEYEQKRTEILSRL